MLIVLMRHVYNQWMEWNSGKMKLSNDSSACEIGRTVFVLMHLQSTIGGMEWWNGTLGMILEWNWSYIIEYTLNFRTSII